MGYEPFYRALQIWQAYAWFFEAFFIFILVFWGAFFKQNSYTTRACWIWDDYSQLDRTRSRPAHADGIIVNYANFLMLLYTYSTNSVCNSSFSQLALYPVKVTGIWVATAKKWITEKSYRCISCRCISMWRRPWIYVHNYAHVSFFINPYLLLCRRRGGLMVSALDSGSSGPGSSPCRGHCVVFLSKTLNSHSASLHPGV